MSELKQKNLSQSSDSDELNMNHLNENKRQLIPAFPSEPKATNKKFFKGPTLLNRNKTHTGTPDSKNKTGEGTLAMTATFGQESRNNGAMTFGTSEERKSPDTPAITG